MEEEYQEDTFEEAQEASEQAEDIQDMQYDQLDEVNFPTQKAENNLYSLFWKVVRAKDSTKVANLNNTEIGPAWMPVRGSKQMALLSLTFHHPGLYAFFASSGETVNATSMSRMGWLGELFVSTKKFQQKAKVKSGSQTPEQKWKIFQKTQPQAQSAA